MSNIPDEFTQEMETLILATEKRFAMDGKEWHEEYLAILIRSYLESLPIADRRKQWGHLIGLVELTEWKAPPRPIE